jgi:imidazolonepropionase-like amidohydrolase
MPGPEQTRPEVTLEEMRAAYEVAHDWGRLAGCHVMGSEAIRRVIEAEVDIIEHGQYLTDSLAEELVRREIYLTPTLSPYMVQTMHPRFARGEQWAAEHRLLWPGHRAGFAAAVRAGVKLLVGTDSTGCYAEEVGLMREAGVSAADTLLSCTSTAAKALRLDKEVGTVEQGKKADLVVLNGNPLIDPYALELVDIVVKGGNVHQPRDLAYSEGFVRDTANMTVLGRTPDR